MDAGSHPNVMVGWGGTWTPENQNGRALFMEATDNTCRWHRTRWEPRFSIVNRFADEDMEQRNFDIR